MKNQVLIGVAFLLSLSLPSAMAQYSVGGQSAPPRYIGGTNKINPYYLNNGFGGYGGGMPGYNNGFYNPYYNPYAGFNYNPYQTPVFWGPPRPLNNGLFNLGLGPVNINLWKAPSGYYYPWCNPAGYNAAQIIYIPQGQTQATPQLPPLSTMFSDLNSYLDDQKSKGKLADADFAHLRQRSKDLQTKAGSLRTASGDGQLDPQDEAQLRKDLDQLSTEVAQRTKI